MKKTTKILGIVAVLALSAMMVSAGILTYYGKVETTANVQQSVVLDGNNYDMVVEKDISTTAGCCVCHPHYLKNRACVDAPVDMTCSSDSAYEVLFLAPPVEDYELDESDFYKRGGTHEYSIDVDVEHGSGYVQWTVDYSDIGGSMTTSGCQLVIGDGTVPLFQVFVNSHESTTPAYKPYSSGWGSYESLPTGITMTGNAGDTHFVITIDTSLLSDCPCGIYDYYWAMNCETTWSGASDQYCYPPAVSSNIWTSSVNYKHDGYTPITFPMTLPPQERVDFVMCYKFHVAAVPGVYNIITSFIPGSS